MITYDTVFTTGSGSGLHTWTLRITRPLHMFTPNHPDTASRPAIITMPGLGEVGTNAADARLYGPHYWMDNGWDGSVALGNGTHYPIIITILTSATNVRPAPMLACMNIILNTYHIKRNSVHVGGLSMGGMTWGRFLSFAQSSGDETAMSMIKSFVSLQGIANDLSIGYNLPGWAAFGRWAKKYGGRFFGLEGTNDNRGVYNARNAMRDSVPNSAYFSFETIGGGTHCCWNTMYNPGYRNWRCEAPVTSTYIGYNGTAGRDNSMGTYIDNSSIFQWMLRQGDTTLVTGNIANQPPVVNAGTNTSIQLPTNIVNLSGTVIDEGGSISYQWTKVSGGPALIVSPNSLSTTVSGLTEGTYVFQLSANDTGGLTGTDQVQITVNGIVNGGQSATAPNKVIVGPGEYQVGFIDTDKHLWGLGNLSNIGINGIGTVGVPKRVLVTPFDLKFNKVAGGLHGLGAVDTAGNVWVMGDNDQYQFGNGTLTASDLPQKILTDSTGNAFTNVRDLVGWFVKDGVNGYNGFYAVKENGTLWGWGRMVFGMRGDGTAGADKPRPVQIIIPGGRLVRQVIAGQFAMVLCTDGTVWTWGQGASANNLGLASPTNESKWYPRQLTGLSNVRMIAGGTNWNYALTNLNVLYGWGSYGEQLGNSNGLPISTPTILTNINNALPLPVSKIVTNSAVTHAILTDGSLWGWGDNGQGTVGNGERVIFTFTGGNPFDRGNLPVIIPQRIAPGVVFDTVFGSTVYTYHSYARDVDGNIYCWGRGKSAVLANQLRPSTSAITASYGNAWDIAWPTPVNPFTITTSYIQTADICVTQPAGVPCNGYVIPANTAPVANAGPDQSITGTSTLLNATASTDNVFISRYEWKQLTGPNSPVINLPASKTPRISNLVTGIYTYELLTEDNGWFTDRDTVTIYVNTAVPPPNQAPTANAGTDQNITLPTSSVTLNGSGTDPDGSIANYLWEKIAGPTTFNIVSLTQTQTIVNTLVQGVYQFRLTVTDNGGAIDRDTVTVTVNAAVPPPNQAPTANAGTNQTITLPTSSVTLNGSGTDPDGNIAAYLWTKIAGPTSFTIVSPTQAQTVVNTMVQGVYQFELRVTDNGGAIDRDTVTVTVNAAVPPPNQAPTASAGADQTITLPTSSVTLAGNGTDPDGTISNYQWTKIAGPTSFTIVSPTQAQTVINSLVQGVYQFELRVTDNGGAIDRDTVTVTVNAAVPPPNQAPTASAGADQTITLPTSSVTLAGNGTDPDGTISNYQWTKIAGPTSFTIVSPTQAQTVINSLVQGVYQFELRVTDNGGAADRDTVIVTVNAAVPPPNQIPTANAGGNQTITLPTNSVTLTGSGTDPDGTITAYLWTKVSGPVSFNIVSPVQFQTVVNNLVQGVYQFELRITDNTGAFGRDTVMITVNAAVPPPNQAPTANAGMNQTITLPTNSITATGSGTDPDGTITAYQWTKIAGPATFNIVSATQAQTVINGLVQGVYQFELRVTDNSGAVGRDTITVTVNAAAPPPPNQAPTANAGANQTITLPTNSITVTGSGTDPDGTIAAYQWTQIAAGPASFNIVNAGQSQTLIDNLEEGVYQFELRVTDNQGAIGRDTVTITVNPDPRTQSDATVFPNPATDIINIRIDAITNQAKTTIRIYDARGMILYHEQFTRTQQVMIRQVDVSKFPSGSYFIKIDVDINNSKTLVVIKQ